MGMLSSIKPKPPKVDKSLESKLDWLCGFGEPRLGRLDTGWYARVDMRVSVRGSAYEVRSEFGHATATSAIDECIERVKATVALAPN